MSVRGGTGWFLVTWVSRVGTVWYLVVLGQNRMVLFDI